MERSLGLAAYRALARRGNATYALPDTPRPLGEIVWIHAAEPDNLLAVQDLAARLCAARVGLNVLITVPEDAPTRDTNDIQPVIHAIVPSENPGAVEAFLDFWQPDTGIWIWGALRPNLILAAAQRAVPLFLVDADSAGFDARRNKWLPDLTRRLLSNFQHVMTRSTAGQRRLTGLGLSKQKVSLHEPLLAGGQALDCVDSDLSDLSTAMGGRSAWFAAAVLPKEIPIVLQAHRQALRWSHRLLLILNPASRAHSEQIAEACAETGLSYVTWDNGQYPDDTTQVMITEDPVDRGLFFRVAPVSFMGSTLVLGNDGCDPLDAAALGSAVLYGPRVRHHMQSYSRLAAAGAARIVNDANALTTAVSRLIAPDQAAAMAHAGWDVISQGAELTDRVVELTQEALDQRKRNP